MASIDKSLEKTWKAMEDSRGIRVKTLYIEKRPEGDYAVRKSDSERASAVTSTQAEAIARARKMYPGCSPDVERVRHTASGKPDRWRKA